MANEAVQMAESDLQEVVCYCAGTTNQQIRELVAQGVSDFERISRITGACSGCGGCEDVMRKLLIGE